MTGSARGIGAAVAHRLRTQGTRVVGCDIKPEFTSVDFECESVDVTNVDAVTQWVDRAVSTWGRIDVLVNVAGVHDGFVAAHHLSDETWERVLEVDLSAPFRVSRAVLPTMMAQRSGSIVNIASVAGLSGAISGTAYTAAKHGLVGLTRSIAALYKEEGIRCNAVCPGSVSTDLGANDAGRDTWSLERLGSRRTRPAIPATPDQVASLVAFLASNESAYITGAVIPIDGGWLS